MIIKNYPNDNLTLDNMLLRSFGRWRIRWRIWGPALSAEGKEERMVPAI